MNPSQEAKAQLGSRLRRVREDAGLTGRAFAAQLGWAASKVSRIETGKQSATTEDVAAWAATAGLRGSAVASLVEESRQVRFEYAAWRTRLQRGTAPQQRANIGLDVGSSFQRVFEPDIVPGLLQTEDYATCVLRHVVEFDRLPDDVAEGVLTRLRRQTVLHDESKQFQFLLAEAALRYRICPASILAEQIAHLQTVAQLPNVEVRILPLDTELPVPPLEGFWIYDDAQVRVETLNAELVYRQPYDVERYCRMFAGLWSVSSTLRSKHSVASQST